MSPKLGPADVVRIPAKCPWCEEVLYLRQVMGGAAVDCQACDFVGSLPKSFLRGFEVAALVKWIEDTWREGKSN